MALLTTRLGDTLTQKARSKLGIRFGRFTFAAVAAFATTEVVLTICAGPLDLTATWGSLISWFSGALVSYVLSRWAWKRKGRPSLLKETLPFWLVSLGAWLVLGATSHYASVWALSMGHTHWQRVVIVDGAYLIANAVTFAARFVIFHYLLFADRGSKLSESVVSAAEAAGVPEVEDEGPAPSAPLAASGSGARLGGSASWAEGPAARSSAKRSSPDPGALPEPGTRR